MSMHGVNWLTSAFSNAGQANGHSHSHEGHSHSHDHGHSHGDEESESINLRGAVLHIIG